MDKKYIFDVSKLEIKDLEGSNYVKDVEAMFKKPIHRVIGNVVYMGSTTIETRRISEKIFEGEKVELTQEDKNIFDAAVDKMSMYDLFPFIIQGIKDHVKVKSEPKEKAAKKTKKKDAKL